MQNNVDYHIPGLVDYKEEAKRLIQSQYIPTESETPAVKLTTADVYKGLTKAIPKTALVLQDVYTILTELGYSPRFTPKETIREVDDKDNPTEVDKEFRMDFVWFFDFKK